MTKFSLPDSLSLIVSLRQDLLKLGFLDERNERTFAQWLVCHGFREYPILLEWSRDEIEIMAWLADSSRDVPGLSRIELAIWDSKKRHQRYFPLPASAFIYRQRLRIRWPEKQLGIPPRRRFFSPGFIDGSAAANTRRCPAEDGEVQRSGRQVKAFGVNLVGYATYALGIGEDLRTTYFALKHADISTSIIDFAPGDIKNRRELTVEKEVSNDASYAISLLCLTANESGRYWLDQGMEQLRDSYVIGYWPWELEKWPEPWLPFNSIVDEVWVSSNHIAKALRPHLNKPLKVMPLCVDDPSYSIRQLSEAERIEVREHFGLNPTAVYYIFSFDLNSSIDRKNPWGCLQAFQEAFPFHSTENDESSVGLVIKSYPPTVPNEDWMKLQHAAEEDPRITIIEANLERSELAKLYGCCDSFLSLHRAEGYGRNLAEALQVGLDVIATDWSGNTDFMTGPLANNVAYKFIGLTEGQYQFWEEQRWADPDLKDAVLKMKAIRKKREDGYRPSPEVLRDYRSAFSIESRSNIYRERLEEIWSGLDGAQSD